MDRPRHIDLKNLDTRPQGIASRIGLPSPRIQHYDGDVPPSLSPLDAFAAHSRRLAKELEETRIAGQRRLSRLPPQVVTKSLTQHQASRPAIFRSLSANSQEEIPPVPLIDHEYAPINAAITAPSVRPKSAYPRISQVPGSNNDEQDASYDQNQYYQESIAESFAISPSIHQTSHPSDYFGAPQSQSPVQEYVSEARTTDNDERSRAQQQQDPLHGLAPPNAAFARTKGYHESSEDDYASSNAGSFFSQPRKLSSSSGVSVPQSPAVAHQRSPSNNSTTSLTGPIKLPPHLNFSRPRSSASFHSKIDSPTLPSRRPLQRKSSYASEIEVRGISSFDDTRSITSDGALGNETASYTHSKFILPRGRAGDRTSNLFSALSTPHFEWSEPMFPSTPPLSPRKDFFDSVPNARLDQPSEAHKVKLPDRGVFSFDVERKPRASFDDLKRPSSSGHGASIRMVGSDTARPSTSHGSSRGASRTPLSPTISKLSHSTSLSELSRSSASTSTIRAAAPSRPAPAPTTDSAEEHVTKAIRLHEHGDLKESTYHLRIAAKQNHPTGMLLYALACRHGWGMRPNPKEAVLWLKKAVDTARLEVADDEENVTGDNRADFHEKKAHRAQFALGIYELGMSHLNGWGVEQDKALALRCFEIGGQWGDADALTEAGFCYAEGIGCKKNLKKAAHYYRRAADKGVSMVGNSWIYKDKYNDKSDDKRSTTTRETRTPRKAAENEKEKIPRSKSRTRSIFGRKKSVAGPL